MTRLNAGIYHAPWIRRRRLLKRLAYTGLAFAITLLILARTVKAQELGCYHRFGDVTCSTEHLECSDSIKANYRDHGETVGRLCERIWDGYYLAGQYLLRLSTANDKIRRLKRQLRRLKVGK